MLLAIEQGNTNTMFAVHDGQTWIAQWRTATQSTRTADEYAVWLSQLLAMAGLSVAYPHGPLAVALLPAWGLLIIWLVLGARPQPAAESVPA